jgi:mono/diheme cytochrome c family protein
MGRIILGIVIGLVLAPCIVLGWFKWGNPPVAVADKPLPFERNIVAVPMHARIDREMVKDPPIQPDEQNFIAGAHIYQEQCAACHGFHGKSSDFAAHMFPRAPQLWTPHRNGKVVGVSDDPPGETFWKVANGIRLTGMPSYKTILNDTQMWQVTLLLANADKPLPPEAAAIVSGQTPAPQMPEAITPAKPGKK